MPEQLPTLVDKLEDLPEALRPYYDPVDENDSSAGFAARLDRATDRARIKEFRQTNNNLKQEVEGYQAQIKQVEDLQQRFDALSNRLNSEDEKKALEAGDIDGVVSRRVESALAAAEQKYAALQGEYERTSADRDALRQQVGRVTVRDAVTRALDESKMRPRSAGALDDLMRRVNDTWRVDDNGQLVAQQNGQQLYGEGGRELEMKEYVGRLAQDAPYFFEAATGAGAPGSRNKPAPDTRGRKVVPFNDPAAIGKNLDALLAKKAVLGGR